MRSDRRALGLVLAREAEQALHDVMSPLRLFVKFFDVIGASRFVSSSDLQQLAIAQNRGERIIQLVSNAGNELSHGCHLFALQELLLRAPQALVGVAGFFQKE